jgi:hypothetical protein
MSASDGTVIGAVKVVDNGSAVSRWNLVFVAEGYQNADLPDFATAVQDFATELFATEPFTELRRAVNIYRIDVASHDRGADDPGGDCGGTGTMVDTYFDATFCGDGVIRRLLVANDGLVLNVVDDEVPQAHAVVVLVNTTTRGGSGGSVAVSSMSNDWKDIVLHELGHSPFGLADEYDYWAGCGVDTDRDNHGTTEPSEPNVTRSAQGTKWRSLRTPGVPLPTTNNPDCSECDDQANPVAAGTVGAFEGAHYFHCGAYRPEFTCKMRSSSRDFCAVCRCRIWKTLAQHMPSVFLGNTNSKEVHWIRSRNGNCQFCEIKPGNRRFFNTLNAAHNAGYDNCHWCLGGSTR